MTSIGPIRLVRAPRFDLLPLWAVILTLVWGAGVAVATALQQNSEAGGTLCILRATTGVPCPTCGSTRAVLAIGRGEYWRAVMFNPMLVVGGTLLAGLIIAQFLFRVRPQVELTVRSRRMVWLALIIAFVLNWALVIVRDAPWANIPP